MAISIFPSTAAEFVSNNFVVDMNDSTNNSVTLENVKQAGTYNISISGDSSFDIYLLDSDGALVAYTNTTTVSSTGLFQIVVVLGVSNSQVISFSYAGNVNNADGEGDQPGAGAYLTSITPSDLPSIDDTATVTGGNFASDVAITFESGATVLSAKNIVVNSSTELLVTRPDGLVEDDSPYTLKAVNPGITPPTGSNAHILTNAVTAGGDPTWVTNSPLTTGTINQAYSETLEATDSDGAIVSYTVTAGALPAGLSLNSSTGVISGTITGSGQTFTVTVEDDGGNTTPRVFTIPVQLATGGTVTQSGGFFLHTFETSGTFEPLTSITDAEYLIVAGGGGGGGGDSATFPGGGGGAGGLLDGTATLSAQTYSVTIGAGGSGANGTGFGSDGSDSSLATIGTAVGGGGGAQSFEPGRDGGSGGGGAYQDPGGSGTAGQGFDGAPGGDDFQTGGGGGASEAGSTGTGGRINFRLGGDGKSVFGTIYAGGGAGYNGDGGLGGGGDNPGGGNGSSGTDGTDGLGAGGGCNSGGTGGDGGSGVVIVRYAV